MDSDTRWFSENKVTVVLLIAIVVLGSLFGWQLRSMLLARSDTVISKVGTFEPSETIESGSILSTHNTSKNDGATSAVSSADEGPKSVALVAKHEWTHDQFISSLAEMPRNEFSELLESQYFDSIFNESPELYVELVSGLLDTETASLKERLFLVLEFRNFEDSNHIAERLIMSKIQAYERAPEWLAVLKRLGMKEKDNVLYIKNQLAFYTDSRQVSDSIYAIARSPFPFSSNFGDGDLEAIVATIEPYLESEEDHIRASAISTVAHYPFLDKEAILQAALSDPSSDVRLEAMYVVANQHIKPAEIQNLVLSIMSNESAPPLERLTAYQISNIFPLTEEQYEAAYEFGLNEVEEQKRRYVEERRTALTESSQ